MSGNPGCTLGASQSVHEATRNLDLRTAAMVVLATRKSLVLLDRRPGSAEEALTPLHHIESK